MDAPLAAELTVIVDGRMKRDIGIPYIMAQFHRIEQDTILYPLYGRPPSAAVLHPARHKGHTRIYAGVLRIATNGFLLVPGHFPGGRIAIVIPYR